MQIINKSRNFMAILIITIDLGINALMISIYLRYYTKKLKLILIPIFKNHMPQLLGLQIYWIMSFTVHVESNFWRRQSQSPEEK